MSSLELVDGHFRIGQVQDDGYFCLIQMLVDTLRVQRALPLLTFAESNP